MVEEGWQDARGDHLSELPDPAILSESYRRSHRSLLWLCLYISTTNGYYSAAKASYIACVLLRCWRIRLESYLVPRVDSIRSNLMDRAKILQ